MITNIIGTYHAITIGPNFRHYNHNCWIIPYLYTRSCGSNWIFSDCINSFFGWPFLSHFQIKNEKRWPILFYQCCFVRCVIGELLICFVAGFPLSSLDHNRSLSINSSVPRLQWNSRRLSSRVFGVDTSGSSRFLWMCSSGELIPCEDTSWMMFLFCVL